MPIDTRQKRVGAYAARVPFLRILPIPDGTIDDLDRAALLGFYGIEVEADIVPASITLAGSYAASITLAGSYVAKLTLAGSDTDG